MSLSPFRTYAVLPKGVEPAFPEKCVGCGADRPERHVTLWTMSTSWWVVLLPIAILFSKATKVRFPACRRCSWRIRFRRMISTAVMLALLVAAIALVRPWVKIWPKLFQRLAMAGAALVVLLPWAFWEGQCPAAVTIDLDDDKIRYEFREIEFAAEFRLLNRDTLLE